ncbi:hypothetical protein QYF50_01960 [Paenibacillus vini]|uniref:hypothetical protein n=1 Tax=Paenibacillus vini TaxID=1476024 RepID=UPI0025B7355C|nr:hypothetical protein [Paenibacillus vini]MDN4066646.1 hypothetical protein [Paenibacillus vini]
MARGIKQFIKANNFHWKTFKKYWKNSSKSELLVDVFVPLIVSTAFLAGSSFFISDFGSLINKFRDLSGQVIAAISILAGFNITSITVISATGGQHEEFKKREVEGQNLYDALIVFFTWAVIIQLTVVMLSIFLFYLGSILPNSFHMGIPIWGWFCATIWLTLTIHSIFISLRNIKTLYFYVTYKPHESIKIPPSGR